MYLQVSSMYHGSYREDQHRFHLQVDCFRTPGSTMIQLFPTEMNQHPSPVLTENAHERNLQHWPQFIDIFHTMKAILQTKSGKHVLTAIPSHPRLYNRVLLQVFLQAKLTKMPTRIRTGTPTMTNHFSKVFLAPDKGDGSRWHLSVFFVRETSVRYYPT